MVIADELNALGWRLAGAQTLISDERSVERCFAYARLRADLLLITADLAAHLPDAVLSAALLGAKPLTVVIATLPSGREPPDLAREVNHALGIAL